MQCKAWFVLALMLSSCAAESAKTTSVPSSNDVAPSNAGAGVPTSEKAPAAQARGDLARAQNEVETALGVGTPDCASACRALASLERATDHLCELSDPSECKEAKDRVVKARDRVTKACGGCR